MLRYGSRPSVSTTTTITEKPPGSSSETGIKGVRLTLHVGDNGTKGAQTSDATQAKIDGKETWKKTNGLVHRERPAGRESPQQHLRDTTNGVPEHHGPKVYGIVQRTGSDRQREVMAREWTVSHLQDEMRYIKEVRDSLEKVRERMYGQFGGMQQTMDKLSQEIRAANSHRRSLESEVKVRTAAMDSFDQMNSSLISANIGLQKSILENCKDRVDTSKDVKSLRSACEKAKEQLRDKERELAAAKAENQTLRLQVESSQEANCQALREMSAKLQREYEEKLQEEQRKHREEIENLQAQLDEYIRRLEEADRNLRLAEAKIAERDQRIIEVERLLDCMGKEKNQLQTKLQDCEQRLRLMELSDTTDATVAKRSKELQGEVVDLRERIRHLNDMVFCQQRKVKGMIEEVESLRAQVAQKDMFISELLDRIAIVECENNELEDKLKYFMSIQNRPQEALETREIGVGCDLLPRHEAQNRDVEPVHSKSAHVNSMLFPSPVQPPSPVKTSSPTQPLSPTQSSSPVLPSSPKQPSSPREYSSYFLTSPTPPRTFRPTNPPPSRLESSLLKYTPVQYSNMLQSNSSALSGTFFCNRPSESKPDESPVRSGRDEVDADRRTDTQSSREESSSSPSSSQPRSRSPRVYTPFMKLMEITSQINILWELTVMSSSWTERQGQVGDLRKQSTEELQELLLRQEKILSNKRLLRTLPDRGEKIKDFAEKVRLAIEQHHEEERRQALVSSAKTEFQSKYQQSFTSQQCAVSPAPAPPHQDRNSQDAAGGAAPMDQTSPVSANLQDSTTVAMQHEQVVSSPATVGACLNSDETKEDALVEALDRVTLSETSTEESKGHLNHGARDNYFSGQQPSQKPHYMTVLENSDKLSGLRKQKFKPNQLPLRKDISPSGSMSPGQSPGSASPLSAQARRERDRKHLDDITAAKLPPLRYEPAKFLSLEESSTLLREQTKKQQELQAKLAAQKLSEGLKISMGSYSPDGGPMAAYREVCEGDQLSSEED
ncbi:protein GRINL1A [Menidia menidia]